MISFFLTEYAGEHVIDLENPAHKQLWKDAKSSPNFVAREIGEVAGKHKDENGDDVFIDPEDIVVVPCSWHYGKKDRCPIDFVRFISRTCNAKPPMAHQVDLANYETSLPGKYQKNVIRVFCRSSCTQKQDLLAHKFESWISQRLQNIFTVAALDHPKGDSAEGSFGILEEASVHLNDAFAPVILTQASDDEDDCEGFASPPRNRKRPEMDPSPIPYKTSRF